MYTSAQRVPSRKQIALSDGDRIAIGIDTHKKTYSVCLWSVGEDHLIKQWVQPSDTRALMHKLQPLRAQVDRIVYEAGPTGFVLARALAHDGWPVQVTSPADMPVSRNAPKCDRKDAQLLARLAAKDMLARCHVPTEQEEHERQLVRMRDRILADKNRARLRIKSLLLCHGLPEPAGLRSWSKAGIEQLHTLACPDDLRMCLNIYLGELAATTALLKTCDQELARVGQRLHNKAEVDCLCTIPGIAGPSALHFIVEMGSRGRFYDRIEVCKYQGLSPEVRSSGESRDEQNLTRSGNRRLRTMLVEAAWRWIRYDESAGQLYGRMMHNTGCSQKAIVGVARKLGIIMWKIRESLSNYRRAQQLNP
jgi:transposase